MGQEEEVERRKNRNGERKGLWNLVYADDVVLIASGENWLKEMMERFAKYVERKGMKLSAEKSKVMVFEKRGKENGG